MSKIPFDFWEGYVCTKDYHANTKHIFILAHTSDHVTVCSCCNQPVTSFHDTRPRIVRDAPVFGRISEIHVPIRRVKCPTCGVRNERVTWLKPGHRNTIRMEHLVASLLAQHVTIKDVSAHYHLHWDTVKEIDKNRMNLILEYNPVNKSQLRELMIDEFAIQKGHKYATVVAEANTRRVLWVGIGNSREDVRPFFTDYLKEYCKNIRAVAMDMNASFDLEVHANCPNAEVVYDLFHVVARFGRDVLDRVRVDTANELKHDKKARKVVKTSKWILLKNKENLNEDQKVHLKEVLDANAPLTTIYIAKDLIKSIWKAPSIHSAKEAWNELMTFAAESKVEPLKKFCKNLEKYRRGILAHAIFRMGTSPLEGMNNKIKVIKRIAYGFRDFEFFILKIKTAFHLKA